MDIELTTTTALPPTSSESLTTSPESTTPLPPSSQILPTTPLSTSIPAHQMHPACRNFQSKMPIRRRCRSECLQITSATNPSIESYLEHLSELRQKLHFETLNGTDETKPKTVIGSHLNSINGGNLVNGKRMFSLIDSYCDNDRHDENIKENISTDLIINEIKNKITDDTNVLDDLKINGDYTDFCCDDLTDLCADQALIDNQKLLLKINEEIDKKYFDVINSARNGQDQIETENNIDSTKLPLDDTLQTNGHDAKPATENRRRVRARSESDPNEIYPLENKPPLTEFKCAGDDVSFISKTLIAKCTKHKYTRYVDYIHKIT